MAATAKKSADKLNINISDGDIADMVKTVLVFESGVRGRSIGQTAYEMVMEAADVDSYPDEVRECLREMSEEGMRIAVERSLRAAASLD